MASKIIRDALLAAAFFSCLVAQAAAEQLHVGVAKIDITPEHPVRLNGYAARQKEFEGVTHPIWAKALAFGDAENGPAILITADNLCVPDDVTQEVARRLAAKIGLKRERLAITATHTHTAPMLKNAAPTIFGVELPREEQEHIERYTATFTDKLVAVAVSAVNDIQPAEVSRGSGKVGFAANRRTKGGPVDHDLPMLVVTDLHGVIRAVYFSYACHCVTLSHNKVSGDWAGFAQEEVEKLNPNSVALASVGCGADSNPDPRGNGNDVELCRKQGREISEEIRRLLAAGLKPVSTKPTPRLTRVDVAFDTPRTKAEWEARTKGTIYEAYHARLNLARLERGEKLPEKISYPVQSWVFGDDLAIIFMPGETVVDYSLRLKRELDRSRIWVNGYSNDGRCYIPSERVLKEGGYEGGGAMIYYDMPNRFAPGLEQKLINAVESIVPHGYRTGG